MRHARQPARRKSLAVAGSNARGGQLSRRRLAAISVAAGMVANTPVSAGDLSETEVRIKTPDGTCDASLIHPETGTHPGVIVWPDAFGLRPEFRAMGRRLAAEGYTVLTVNPYYRIGSAPVADKIDFDKPDAFPKLMELISSLTDERIAKDAQAYVTFLDGQAAVKTSAKIGTTGYCMGGRLTMLTAATAPGRVGAGGSFHGGGLVTDKPNSPHLLAPKIKARYYFAVASDDDEKEPDAKNALKAAFAAAKVPAEIEVYAGALHGWCVPGDRERDGKRIYDEAKANVAWGHLLSLFKTALV